MLIVFVVLHHVLNEMKRMINLCKGRGVRLVICTVPPVTRDNVKADVVQLNLALKEAVTEDKNDLIETLETEVAAQFLKDDEIHFGLAGIAIMAQNVATCLRRYMRIRDRAPNTSRRPVIPWANRERRTQADWFEQRNQVTGRGDQRYRQDRQRDSRRYQREVFPAKH